MSVCLPVCLSVGRSDGRTVGLSTCLSVYRLVCQSASLLVCQFVAFLSVGRRLVGRSGGSGWRESRVVADGWACGAMRARARVCLCCRSVAQALGELQVSHSVLCWGAGGAQRFLSTVGKHRRGRGHADYAYSCVQWCVSVSSPHARKRAVA